MNNFERLMEVLRDGKWHSGDELAVKISYRFGHTVFEARRRGCSIEKRQVGRSRFEYRMLMAQPIS